MESTASPLVRRHNDSLPILSPIGDGWEGGVTLNAAATYLQNEPANAPLIHSLLREAKVDLSLGDRGVVAVYYRARPKKDPGYLLTRSWVGLSLFTPDFELIHRFADPIISPGSDSTDPDYLGVEDPRISMVDGKFVLIYCGSGLDRSGSWRGTLCTAESTDLFHWTKTGPVDLQYRSADASKPFDNSYFDNMGGLQGTSTHVNNKDGVFFPHPIDGWHYLLHRPMVGQMYSWSIHLARSKSAAGPFVDLGAIASAEPHPDYQDSWLGGGAVPIDLGDGRYLEIYHSGHRNPDSSRYYTLGCLMFDFKQFDPEHPASLIVSRVDHFMVPETKFEIEGPFPDSVGNVLFSCGAYEIGDDICILYGGGDTFVMAARVNKAALLDALEPVQV